MARLSRVCLPEIPQHIIQRGNNRQICFGSDEDMAAYAYWLEKYSFKYDVAVQTWVFMTNHTNQWNQWGQTHCCPTNAEPKLMLAAVICLYRVLFFQISPSDYVY